MLGRKGLFSTEILAGEKQINFTRRNYRANGGMQARPTSG